MFLLVINFKMIGMLLNVVHGQVQKIKLTKTYNKGFPNHSTLINYDSLYEKPFNGARICKQGEKKKQI